MTVYENLIARKRGYELLVNTWLDYNGVVHVIGWNIARHNYMLGCSKEPIADAERVPRNNLTATCLLCIVRYA